MKPLRVLQIISNLEKGSGVAQVVLNWHRNIDTTKVQFDYLISQNSPNTLSNIVTNYGGNVYLLPNPKRNIFAFLFATFNFFRTHSYKIVHSHITQFNLFYFPLAKLFHVKHIILHSHSTTYSGSRIKSIINRLMLWPVRCLVSHRLAVSQEAGEFLFKRKTFKVIPNGISPSLYPSTLKEKEKSKRELKIENYSAIGHVGRFSAEKNHTFLLEIFKEYKKIDPKAKLVLIGKGPLENNLKGKIHLNNLENDVVLKSYATGKDLYSAMDILVFPSLKEGFGLVPLEAIAAGIPVLVSSAIPTKIREIAKMPTLSLNEPAKTWAKYINNLLENKNVLKNFPKEFDIATISNNILSYYLNECAL